MYRNTMAVYLGLVAAMSFYGLSFLSTKTVLQELGPITILLVRITLSAGILQLISLVIYPRPGSSTRPGSRIRPRVSCQDLKFFLLAAVFQPFIYFMAENYGLHRVSPAAASIIIGTIPVITPVAAAPILGERLSPLNFSGLVLSLLGVVVLTSGDSGGGSDPLGVGLIFIAVLAAAGYAIAVRRIPSRYDAITIVKMQNLLGIPMVLPFFLLFEAGNLSGISSEAAGHLGFLAVFPSTLSFVLLSHGIRIVGAGRANAFANLVPVFTALFSLLLLDQAITLHTWLGMALVIGGVSVAQRKIAAETRVL